MNLVRRLLVVLGGSLLVFCGGQTSRDAVGSDGGKDPSPPAPADYLQTCASDADCVLGVAPECARPACGCATVPINVAAAGSYANAVDAFRAECMKLHPNVPCGDMCMSAKALCCGGKCSVGPATANCASGGTGGFGGFGGSGGSSFGGASGSGGGSGSCTYPNCSSCASTCATCLCVYQGDAAQCTAFC